MKDIIRIDSIAQINKIFGRSKTRHPLISIIFYDEHSASPSQEYQDAKVVPGVYYLGLKEMDSCHMGYGRNAYDFESGSMIFTAPNQVITVANMEDGQSKSGWGIFFHPDLIRKSHLGATIDEYSFFSYDVSEGLHLSDDEKETITDLVYKIDKELNQNIDKHSQELIVSTLELILKYANRFYDRQFYTRTNLNKDFVSKFETLLRDYQRSDKPATVGIPTVKYCGEQLNMSPKYLSDLLKKETGRNAKEHIHFFLIEKAKTDLLSSTVSVSEIAYDLGFEYPQHFSKLFKAKTGYSPSEYRVLN